MYNVDIENVRNAVKIFFKLIEKGEINKIDDREYMDMIDQSEVSDVLNVMEEETGTIILRGSDRIYISAKTDNKVFGYNNEELRNLLKVSDNSELYLCYFIMLCIMCLFYAGEGYDMKCREFIEIEEIHRYADDKIKSLEDFNKTEEVEATLQINFGTVVQKWNSMIVYDERKVNVQSTKNSRMAFIKKVCAFLRDQGLAIIEEDKVLRTTEKMDRMVTSYYTADDRKQEIMDFINGIKKDDLNADNK
ncbi:DUF6063 family protein [Thermoanaerobacterium sp. RBIITD]|uniref:DUF6063 family protein n=1 Tax=Thermoanaerobacterium sp. RBIITD TaxID=1550240 RepID=UPI000BB80E29|nr:DUF6063 family protein [Thermoanaerobacterium sp. RBIITD]SNX53654.1 hypothetical protein SAMN05660242_1214 [Thermoanaerobacterium sp. RBIITD]